MSQPVILYNGKPMICRSKDGKYICLLCRRQFAAEQQLTLHCEMSSLHKENMESNRSRISQSVPDEATNKRKNKPDLNIESKKARTEAARRSYGRIKFWNEQKGFGFVTVDLEDAVPGAEELFVHRTKCIFASDDDTAVLFPEQEVSFVQGKQQDGRPCANDVRNANGTPLPVPKSARSLSKDQAGAANVARDKFAQQLLANSYTDSWQGQKDRNEDRYTNSVISSMGAFFGLYDGHGGSTCSEYLAKNLQRHVRNALQQGQQRAKSKESRRGGSPRDNAANGGSDDITEPGGDSAGQGRSGAGQGLRSSSSSNSLVGLGSVEEDGPLEKDGPLLQSAFTEAFEEADAAYLQVAQRCKYIDGSTGLACMLYGDGVQCGGDGASAVPSSRLLLCVANAGDCRAVLCRGGEAVRLTSDHKPNTKSERRRIESAGGYVAQIKVRRWSAEVSQVSSQMYTSAMQCTHPCACPTPMLSFVHSVDTLAPSVDTLAPSVDTLAVQGIWRVCTAAGAGVSVKKEKSMYLAVSRSFGDKELKVSGGRYWWWRH
jgi:serine/threonine protein phosphatase PrpC/cold shock CspA family protein